jgi:hypothetical protein
MARHKNPQYNRKRLVVAGIAAVTTLGVAVGIGVYGSAFADRGNQDTAANEQCLPTDSAPPSSATEPPPEESAPEETAPTETDTETAPPEEETEAPEDTATEEPEETETGTSIPDETTEKPYRWGADAPLALNGERPPGSNLQPGGGQGGGGQGGGGNGGGGNNGGGDNNGGGGNGGGGNGGGDDDYSGPKPPTQAPEPPADAPEDDFPGGEECDDELGPVANDFIDINKVDPNNLADSPETQEGGVEGTFVSDCGVNEEGHFNSANFIVAPGNENGAEHTHDYVGNEDTDGFSDNDSLAGAGTTCVNQDDKSAYFWPVIRVRNEGSDEVDPLNAHNVGDIQRPVSAKLEFRGNAVDEVKAMPQFLRVLTGNAKSFSQDGVNQNAKWTCTGFEDRITAKYPLCPEGSNTVRIADFPGCWDGQNTDSANHRTHVAFADEDGECQDGFVAIPQLRITITYDLPQGEIFALDAFPTEFHSPVTDHNDFVNVFSEDLMDQVVDCINTGQQCVNQ